ncbi:hypothetical protein V8E36_003125 [Tilletia maclaganii]
MEPRRTCLDAVLRSASASIASRSSPRWTARRRLVQIRAAAPMHTSSPTSARVLTDVPSASASSTGTEDPGAASLSTSTSRAAGVGAAGSASKGSSTRRPLTAGRALKGRKSRAASPATPAEPALRSPAGASLTITEQLRARLLKRLSPDMAKSVGFSSLLNRHLTQTLLQQQKQGGRDVRPGSAGQPAPKPVLRGRKTLKSLRKVKLAAAASVGIGGVNLASARAGALATGIRLANSTPSGGSTASVTKAQNYQPPRRPSRVERAAQNAKAIQRATRASPMKTYSVPHEATQADRLHRDEADPSNEPTVLSEVWSYLSSLFARDRRRSPGEMHERSKWRSSIEPVAPGAFTQNYPSSASLIDSARGDEDHDEGGRPRRHPLQPRFDPSTAASFSSAAGKAETLHRSGASKPHKIQQHSASFREGILNTNAPPFFETLPLHLPADYPPPTPRIPDMELRALALGVNHLAGTDVGPDTAWVLEKPARLEYLGDSVLELATRTFIFREVEDLSPKTMAFLKSHLVSNDILGHLYNQAGLETLRLDTAEWALDTLRMQHPRSAIGGLGGASPNRQDEQRRGVVETMTGGKGLSGHRRGSLQGWLRLESARESQGPSQLDVRPKRETEAEMRNRRLALYLPDLPHSRKADLFEAYLGGLYLSQPPSIASEWVQALLRPFAARAMRHELMQVEEALTRAGVVRRRLKRQQEEEALSRASGFGYPGRSGEQGGDQSGESKSWLRWFFGL